AALRRAGAVNEALQCLRIAMEIDPERVEAGYHLGLVCRAMGRTDDARQIFERVISSDPTNRFAQAAIMNMDAEAHGRIVSEQHARRKTALNRTTQADYFALKPIFDALCDDHWPLFSPDIREISEFRPDAILTTSGRFKGLREQIPECAIVQIPSAAIRRADSVSVDASADAVCAVNDDERDAFLAAGLSQRRVWLTGLALTDGVFEHSGVGRDGRKQVLYMPDWRHDASAAPVMNEALAALCHAEDRPFDVVIRPHPTTLETQPGWVDGWVDLAVSCANVTVHVAAGVDYLSLMARADLLLADFSPVAFTFLAFDAPMVLVRPRASAVQQDRLSDQHVALLESVAACVDEGVEAAERILKLLDAPDSGDENRARMRSRVFGGGADGHAAVRTVSALRGFLDA
ncbi:MAG: CDP-glycerol glycerophosphotransferase family protein, partial [Alphaproteobacteria bacterium]|nr:CDP-glycerol glycerophosphotransferase family protein [Alphaproteobacteria bacterium]